MDRVDRYAHSDGSRECRPVDDVESLGAEILDSSADVEDDGFLTVRGLDNGGCYAGLEFIGAGGRDPIGDPGTND